MVGKPLSTSLLHHERIPKWKALAVLSSDALSSVAYATEEILIPLSIFAIAAMAWSIPIAVGIATLLFIVTISYQQTIEAYPNGGGAYTVARENLGPKAGLVAGAALMIDYVLTVAVSIAAGVENIASAFPYFLDHKVAVGCILIALIMFANLRGIRESANIFAVPTYIFIVSFVLMIGMGIFRALNGEMANPAPIVHEVYPQIPLFLGLRAFASGCAALTGIEAISNGIPIFQEPSRRNARITMIWMSCILGVLFLSITVLAHYYRIIPIDGETTVSQLARTVFGRTGLYYLVQVSTALILILAANTSYADFPRLASLLARDRFLPRQMGSLGDRLVFSNGILGLSVTAALLLVIFQGDTHHLIPLYAVGVFLSFTLSQSGMVVHHLRKRESGWRKGIFFNGLGAVTTALVLCVIAATKFTHGAWAVIILIPILVFLFGQIHIHYFSTAKQLTDNALTFNDSVIRGEHLAIVPVSGIHPGVIDALKYASTIAPKVKACFVEVDEASTQRLLKLWAEKVPQIELVVLKSPFRSVIRPILDFVDEQSDGDVKRFVSVIIPEFVTRKWYHQFLHNQTAILLYAALRSRKNLVVTSVRYHFSQ